MLLNYSFFVNCSTSVKYSILWCIHIRQYAFKRQNNKNCFFFQSLFWYLFRIKLIRALFVVLRNKIYSRRLIVILKFLFRDLNRFI